MEIKKFIILLCVLLLVGCSNNDPQEPPEEPPVVDPFETRTFHVGGIWYDLPIDFQKLVDDGWFPDVITTVEEELAKEINAKTYIQKYYIRNERYMMAVTLYNPTDEPITIAQAKVGEVEGENRVWLKDDILDFKVDEVVTFETTQDQILELWGEPVSKVTEGLYELWTYQHNRTTKSVIHWDSSTKEMFRLKISNMK